jgi:hypothetical protein
MSYVRPAASIGALFLITLLGGCGDSGAREGTEAAQVESCMQCHNGAKNVDWSGPGIENPHPFPGADRLTCTGCHGGNGQGEDAATSHVPPPPEIGDRENRRANPQAFFNRLTLAGIDKFPDYTVGDRTWSAIDYLQFVNPGDLRVTSRRRGCGVCHMAHSDAMSKSPLATSVGIFSGSAYAVGIENSVPEHRGLHEDTAADHAIRPVGDGSFDANDLGVVGSLLEWPVRSVRGRRGPDQVFDNPAFDAPNLAAGLDSSRRATAGSPLATLYREQVAFTCGDCHLGSAGANNRAGDFRSSGCTACHMPYSLGGRSGSADPNVPRDEPLDPDDIDEPERPHVRTHRIRSVKKTLPNGEAVEGIDDLACAGCHQGSNRMVMQYWGIRLDQNQDVRNRLQYPTNPVTSRNTSQVTEIFDPLVGNRTFNGRNANQYLLHEDYDGDGRDDTPADVHREAGLGCIDCHGSPDLHGEVAVPGGGRIVSRMEQHVQIRCENCHGGPDAYAATVPGTAHDGSSADVAVDGKGNVLEHVVRDAEGNYFLTGRLDGRRHFIPQTRDTIVDSGRTNPFTGAPIYSARASYAMGRDDDTLANGIGPKQEGRPSTGFRHGDTMDCASCHASWTNTCVGCHLKGEYNTGNNFSNITGERIVFRQTNADFTYQSPVFFQLGVNARNRITQVATNTKVFFQWEDRNNVKSEVFAFTDRNGGGNNPAIAYPSLGHNALMAHSIRGKVSSTDEGPRYCVACHLTEKALADHRPLYDQFRATLAERRYGDLDFEVLRDHFGRNPGNQRNSPLWVHMVAGLGSGLFTFDRSGAPVNPIDTNANRIGAEGVAPATSYDPARIALDLDRIVDGNGVAQGSSNHMLPPGGPNFRDGATDPRLTGPLGASLIRRLTDPDRGIVLDSWFDADGLPQGKAAQFVD